MTNSGVRMSAHLATRFRELRRAAGQTPDDVASRAASWGLRWKPATVTAIEGGQRALSVAELLLLPAILGTPFVDIVAAEGDEVELAPGLVLDGATVRRLVQSGERWDLVSPFGSLPVEPPGPPVGQQALEAERQAARKLKVSIELILEASTWLWDQSLTAQRNTETAGEIKARGGDVDARTLQALRGHVSRRLTAKVEAAIRSGAIIGTVEGPEPEIVVAGHQIPPSELRKLILDSGWMEQAAAKDLGVGLADVVVVCRWLWGQRLTAQWRSETAREIEARGGELSARTLQALQGHASRRLIAEIVRALAERRHAAGGDGGE
jgi:transcriptional regulator with XRE-family HTH domain